MAALVPSCHEKEVKKSKRSKAMPEVKAVMKEAAGRRSQKKRAEVKGSNLAAEKGKKTRANHGARGPLRSPRCQETKRQENWERGSAGRRGDRKVGGRGRVKIEAKRPLMGAERGM